MAGTIIIGAIGEDVVRHCPIGDVSVSSVVLDDNTLMMVEADVPIEGNVLRYFGSISRRIPGLDAIHVAVIAVA